MLYLTPYLCRTTCPCAPGVVPPVCTTRTVGKAPNAMACGGGAGGLVMQTFTNSWALHS